MTGLSTSALAVSRRIVCAIATATVVACIAVGVTVALPGTSDSASGAAFRVQPEFDLVFASNFLEHFDWPVLEGLVAEILRVLRPGGRLMLVQPNFRLQPGRYFDDYTHRAIFTDVSLSDWLAASGFQVKQVVPKFLPLTVKSRFGGLSFLMPLYLRSPWRPLAGQMLVVAERPLA